VPSSDILIEGDRSSANMIDGVSCDTVTEMVWLPPQ
jgi:hypothetical protein